MLGQVALELQKDQERLRLGQEVAVQVRKRNQQEQLKLVLARLVLLKASTLTLYRLDDH